MKEKICNLNNSAIFALANRFFSVPSPCPGGGIGRRAGFKIQYCKVCGFDSRPGYKNQSEKQSESDVPNSGFFVCSHFLSRSFINFDAVAYLL